MKLKFLFLFLFIANFCEAQDADSTKPKWDYGIVLSSGISNTSYSSTFFDYLYNKIDSFQLKIPNYTSLGWGSQTHPAKYDFQTQKTSTFFSFGIKINPKGNKVINHLIDFGFSNTTGNYSYGLRYGWTDGGSSSFYSVTDSVKSSFTINKWFMGYKFLPTYRNIFLSIGMNAEMNFISINEHFQSVESHSSEFNPQPFYSYYHSDKTIKQIYFTLPVTLGAGALIKLKRFYFIPSYTFSPHPFKGYNTNTFHLALMYKFERSDKTKEPKCHNW